VENATVAGSIGTMTAENAKNRETTAEGLMGQNRSFILKLNNWGGGR
jgi:hypothetical protein